MIKEKQRLITSSSVPKFPTMPYISKNISMSPCSMFARWSITSMAIPSKSILMFWFCEPESFNEEVE